VNGVVKRFEELAPVIFKYVHKADSGDLVDVDLSFSQVITLGLISDKKNPKMTDLASDLGVTLGNVTGIIGRLAASGHVKRREDRSDRRIVRVVLTPKGISVAKKVSDSRKKCLEKIFCKLSVPDRSAIIKLLEKLVEQIKKEGA
jgi:DNA-binding MarR family transcriptional regulator